jgi:hypothetical protein
MSIDFYQHKDYPKISMEYTKDKVKSLLYSLKIQFNDELTSLDDLIYHVNFYNNYCEHSKVSVDCFDIFYTFSKYEDILVKEATKNYKNVVDGNIVFPVMDKINDIAKSLHVLDDPFDDYHETFYFDHDGLLKIARRLCLTDPCDENDDGIDIILHDNMVESDFDEIIHEFFYKSYIRYMCDLPEELRKPITKMTPEEYQVFLMYII